MGHQAYRLSIEWSRIEPVEGQWDESAIRHYVELLSLLCENNIKPVVTLHHFTHPQWFEEKGEFNKAENLPCFYRFVERIVPEIKEYVHSWNIFNLVELNPGDAPLALRPAGQGTSPRLRVMLSVNADRWLCMTVDDLVRREPLRVEAPVVRLR